ncbi:hypothetical protein ACRW7A_17060, partial [Escherichia coli]
FELLLCHGTVCVVGKIRDLILQLSKSSIYSTKPAGTGGGNTFDGEYQRKDDERDRLDHKDDRQD